MKNTMGNIMVGQSGGPTSVVNSSLVGVMKAAQEAGISKVYGMRNGIEGLLKGRYVDMADYVRNDLDIELLKRTPSSFLGTCRCKLPEPAQNDAVYTQLFDLFNRLNISMVIYIGGNDSMDTIQKLSAYAAAVSSEIRFMGVPKTIDNDLAETDHTPGYGSAAKYVAYAMKEIIRDSNTYDMDSVTVVEIMGRNAGWLTAASVLSRAEDCPGPDLIYLPERSFDHQAFLEAVEKKRREHRAVVVAVSESLKTPDGRYICEDSLAGAAEDSFGHKILSGTALYLSDYVAEQLNIKSRGIVFNVLQRCASHMVSRRDVTEAFTAGAEAVRAALGGATGQMIVFRRVCDEPYQITVDAVDVNRIANREKVMPDAWITPEGADVADAFAAYCRPLIIGELTPFMVDGLPRHLYLDA